MENIDRYLGKSGSLLNIAFGYTLILLTIWSTRAVQRKLFWIDIAFFLSVAVLALYQSPTASMMRSRGSGLAGEAPVFQQERGSNSFARFFRRRFRMPELDLPPWHFSIVVIGLGLITAVAVVLVSAQLGTLHRLFDQPDPWLNGCAYLVWAVIQQWIQQSFFFVRLEKVIQRGVVASFTTGALFGLAHVPNPILTPLTFVGGWLLSELYRRYRSVVPLGIAHGFVGIAIALGVPEKINHHMHVGLGYLQNLS